MKFALLAAVAVIATPALAQETPGTAQTDQTMPAGGSGDTMNAPQSDPSMQQPTGGMQTQSTGGMSSGGMSGGMMAGAPTDANAPDPTGGYQPSTAMSGPAPAGARVTFQPAPSPSQAFPPPPPLRHYPICKKGQYDNCMQRGGR